MRVTLEPTGAYHLVAANSLSAAGCQVVLCNPYRARSYAIGIGRLNKSDKHDANALAAFGTQSKIFLWTPPPTEVLDLRAILMRISRVDQEIAREILRSQNAEIGRPPAAVMDSITRVRQFQNAERRLLLEALEEHFARHEQLAAERELLMSIPNVGPTIASHLLYVLRSRHFHSARQVAALIGLVPLHATSGTSVRSTPRTPTTGYRVLRAALYMSAMGMLRVPEVRAFYDRLTGNGCHPRKALMAIMRKTVHAAFGILRHRRPYQADWEQSRRRATGRVDLPSDSSASDPASPSTSNIACVGRRSHEKMENLNSDVRIETVICVSDSGKPYLLKKHTKAVAESRKRARAAKRIRPRESEAEGAADTGNGVADK